MDVRPYTLPGKRLLAQYRSRIESLCSEWAEKWGFSLALKTVENFLPGETSAELLTRPAVRFEAIEDESWAVFQIDDSAIEILGEKMISQSIPIERTDSSSHFLIELGLQALQDLVASLHDLKPRYCPGHRNRLDQCLKTDGWAVDSRSVQIQLQVDQSVICLWLPWFMAEPFIEDVLEPEDLPQLQEPLVSRKHALGPEAVRSWVYLGSADLTLKALSSLRVDDVICLDTSLKDALMLNFSGTTSGLSGYLGKQEGRLALRVDRFVPSGSIRN